MRIILRAILLFLTQSILFGWLVKLVEHGMRRLFWLWGHVRFAALVRNQGRGCVCYWANELKFPDHITLGHNVVIGVNVTLGAAAGIRLDDHVRLSKGVILETAGLDFSSANLPYAHIKAPIHLEEGVWVGSYAIILGGVTIGKRAVVAAGAIVTKDVPAGSVVAGSPARVIKVRTLNVV